VREALAAWVTQASQQNEMEAAAVGSRRGEARPAELAQGALLGMAIFTRQDIGYQPLSGLRDEQGLPRQGAALHLAQGFEAPVTRLKTIAINNVHAVPRQPGGTRTITLLDQRRQHRSALAYQRRRGMRLDPVECVRERDEGGSNLVCLVPIRRSHRGRDTKDHVAEHVIDGRKQHGAGVLLLGCPGKPVSS